MTSVHLNVLFVLIDDLRQQLQHGRAQGIGATDLMRTPHLDALAADALVATHAHVQQALCGPSRASILTGRRPETTGVVELEDYFRHMGCAHCVTLPEFFQQHGYFSFGMGKVFHDGAGGGGDYDAQSWNTDFYNPDDPYCSWIDGSGFNPETKSFTCNSWRAVSPAEEAAQPLVDTLTVNAALPRISELTAARTPWFAAVGIRKPHLPFIVPQRFLDMYPAGSVRLAANDFCPWRLPSAAFVTYEVQSYADVRPVWPKHGQATCNATMPDWLARQLRRAYYAAVSHADDEVGRLLKHVREVDAWERTVVAVVGDHGWKLGEHGGHF